MIVQMIITKYFQTLRIFLTPYSAFMQVMLLIQTI